MIDLQQISMGANLLILLQTLQLALRIFAGCTDYFERELLAGYYIFGQKDRSVCAAAAYGKQFEVMDLIARFKFQGAKLHQFHYSAG